MDKWIQNFVDTYNEMIFENPYYTPTVAIERFPKGFRHFVSNHLFYYEQMTTKTFEDSRFNFILVYRSTPFKFNVDFYLGFVFIYVGIDKQHCDYTYYLPIGKFSISDFLYNFVSGIELEEIQSKDLDNEPFDIDDDQFEFPF